MRASPLAAFVIFLAVTTALGAEPDAAALLDRTVWIDIGIGRTLVTLKPKESATLKRCKEATLFFEKSGTGVAETLYAGMTMRTEYPRASLTRSGNSAVILLYNANSPQPAEMLQLTHDGTVLVQQTRGFRPHTLLRCRDAK